jgi:hypothetical protein
MRFLTLLRKRLRRREPDDEPQICGDFVGITVHEFVGVILVTRVRHGFSFSFSLGPRPRS